MMDEKEFLISVRLMRRDYQYKVQYVRVNSINERFIVHASHKAIVIQSKIETQEGMELKRTYRYDEAQASKKSLMNRIILAIDTYLKEKRK